MTNYAMSSSSVIGNASYLTLYLESNRLSGEIPPSFKDSESIDILNGNMFLRMIPDWPIISVVPMN